MSTIHSSHVLILTIIYYILTKILATCNAGKIHPSSIQPLTRNQTMTEVCIWDFEPTIHSSLSPSIRFVFGLGNLRANFLNRVLYYAREREREREERFTSQE